MRHDEFEIGKDFVIDIDERELARWRCTDKGTRTICAIRIDARDDSWFRGPPYAVAEQVFDEDDMISCKRPKPEPPPMRTFRDFFGSRTETKESIQRDIDWKARNQPS